MELAVVAPEGKTSTKKIDISDRLLNCEFNEALVHQVIVAQLAGRRAGTSAQKTRAEVRGGGKKPWKQKGTGRARAGSTRGPLWTGGGVTFASSTRDYSQKVNKKMYRASMRVVLSELVRQERLIIVDKLELKEAKTKLMADFLKKLDVSRVLVVMDKLDEKIILASQNLPDVTVVMVKEVNPVFLVGCDHVVMTEAGIRALEEQWA